MALFHCQSCGIRKDVPDSFAGKQIRCPSCRKAITVLDTARDKDAGDDDEAYLASVLIPDVPAADSPRRDAGSDNGEQSHNYERTVPRPERPATQINMDLTTRGMARRPFLHGGLPGNVLAGIEGGILLLFYSLTLGVLIHEAAPGLQLQGVVMGMSLTAATIFCSIMSLRGRLPVMAAGPETITCSMFFLFALFIQSKTQALSPDQAGATLVAGMVVTALLTGAGAQIATRYDAGRILRFIPQPVVGGLQAMIGVLLIRGALLIAEQDPFCLKALVPVLGVEQCFKWIPAAAMGVLFSIILYRSKSALLNIVLIALGIGIGNAVFHYWGVPPGEAQNLNLLIAPQAPVPPWEILTMPLLGNVHWQTLLEGLPYLAGASILLIISLADKVYALELLLEDEVDLNDLLQSLAFANILSGIAGGLPGSISVNRCVGRGAIGKRGPLAGVVAGVVCLAALFWSGAYVGYVPRFIPAGLLMFFGFSVLRKWLVDTRRQYTRRDDYALLLVVFGISLLFGILEGMAAAFLLSILVLANRYSRVSVIKHMLGGSTHRSRVDRGAEQLAVLKQRGNEVLLMRLQGFIFLGSTTPIMAAIRKRLQDENEPPLRYLILDFSRVNGLAAQVAISFTQLKQLARKSGFCLIFTSVPLEVEQQLEGAGYSLNEADGTSISFVDADYALEWCEDHILAEAEVDQDGAISIESLLAPIFPKPQLLPRLIPYLEEMTFGSGEYVFRQGDTADAMYFIESGMVTIQLELGGRKTTRLKKMGPGTVFGEMGIYTKAPRTASAVADGSCRLYRLSRKTMADMNRSESELISALHRFMVNLLSQRVSDANIRIMDLVQ